MEDKVNKYMTGAEYYHIFRGRIEYANNLINQRLIWLVTSQSFFYSAYALVLNAPEKGKNPMFDHLVLMLAWILPIAALSSCAFSYLGVLITVFDLPRIKKSYHAYCEKSGEDKDLPSLDSQASVRILEYISTLVMPLIFIGTWIAVLLNQGKF